MRRANGRRVLWVRERFGTMPGARMRRRKQAREKRAAEDSAQGIAWEGQNHGKQELFGEDDDGEDDLFGGAPVDSELKINKKFEQRYAPPRAPKARTYDLVHGLPFSKIFVSMLAATSGELHHQARRSQSRAPVRFEHNEKLKDRMRLKELEKELGSDSETSTSEDEDGELLTSKVRSSWLAIDAQHSTTSQAKPAAPASHILTTGACRGMQVEANILDVLHKIKTKDPSIYSKEKFFDSADEAPRCPSLPIAPRPAHRL